MPTLDQLRNAGRVMSLVMAERLGLDPGEVTNICPSVEPSGERVQWTSVRDVPPGFTEECRIEAARRIEAAE